MSEISDRYRRLSDAFVATVAAVPADRWASPSPCEGWTARDVVEHVATVQGMFLGFVGRTAPALPPVADDPLLTLHSAFAPILEVLDDPVLSIQTFDGAFGETNFAAAIDRFANLDLVVHRWDLARATGGDETVAVDDAERVIAGAAGFGPALRSPGVCGPEIDVAPDADATTRMLAVLGRRA